MSTANKAGQYSELQWFALTTWGGFRAHSGVPQLAQKRFVYAYANTGCLSGVVITSEARDLLFVGDDIIAGQGKQIPHRPKGLLVMRILGATTGPRRHGSQASASVLSWLKPTHC